MNERRFPQQNGDVDAMLRLCGGRAAYNSRRRLIAIRRRYDLVSLLSELDITRRGWKSEAAKRLGVHRGTITRDFRALQATFWQEQNL